MAQRKNFERRSAADGYIIGRRIYEVGSEKYLGIAQAYWRDNNRSMLAILVNDPNPVFIQIDEVLIEVPQTEAPRLNTEDPAPELDQRNTSLIPLGSQERRKRRERASAEGAEDQVREPGVGEDVEPELPHDHDGVDYGAIPRPAIITKDTEIRPAGTPLGRGRDTGKEDNGAPSGGMPTTGGTTMASVGEVKTAIDAANLKANEAQAMARGAIEKIDEATQQYAVALDGSGHDSVGQAHNAMAHAKQQIEESIQAIAAGIEAAGQYGMGL